MAECVDLLIELFRCRSAGQQPSHCSDLVEEVTWRRPLVAAQVDRIAKTLDERLHGLPRGFGHGDFWRENLLVEEGRLSGIVDWVRSGPGRLPLLDLIHLRTAESDVKGIPWGRTLREQLLPWARAGGDDVASRYCDAIGFGTTPLLLESLVIAYWLERLAAEMRSYRDYGNRVGWLAENLDLVLSTVDRSRSGVL